VSSSTAQNRVSLKVVSGRYADESLREARMPANGVGRPPPSLNVRTALAAIPDPMDAKAAPILAAVNRRTDILEEERSHKRITEDEYRVGRSIQAVFELSSRSSSNWIEGGGSRDVAEAHIMQLARGKVRADLIIEYEERLRRAVGENGMRFLRGILGEGKSYAQMAGALPSERKITFVAQRFRCYLAELSESWAATGRR
jgi:hypothetical protein